VQDLELAFGPVIERLLQNGFDLTKTTVEGFLRGQRIASHARSYRKGQHTTVKEHMPKAHREHAEWNPQRIIAWAEKIGPATAELIRLLIDTRTHPEQGYRSALGILRLRKAYGDDRLEAASKRGIAIGARSYKSIASILEKGLDQEQLTEEPDTEPVKHKNIRGSIYYH
jgi:transposase